jgi:site-specific DNA recombinase
LARRNNKGHLLVHMPRGDRLLGTYFGFYDLLQGSGAVVGNLALGAAFDAGKHLSFESLPGLLMLSLGLASAPRALQARRQTLRDVLAQLERQQARLLDLYLAEVIEREEFERRRKEVTQTQPGLRQQLRQLDAQAQQHVNVAALAQGIETFCQRVQSTLDHLTFAQRRQLVALLIDCVIVNDAQVEIRYVVPTGPKGETTPFCHLRLDYSMRPRRSNASASCSRSLSVSSVMRFFE